MPIFLTACGHMRDGAPQAIIRENSQGTNLETASYNSASSFTTESVKMKPVIFPGTSAYFEISEDAKIKPIGDSLEISLISKIPKYGNSMDADVLLHFSIIPFSDGNLTINTITAAENCDPVQMDGYGSGNNSYRFKSGFLFVSTEKFHLWRVNNTCNFPGAFRSNWPNDIENCRKMGLKAEIDIYDESLWFDEILRPRESVDLYCEILRRMNYLNEPSKSTVRNFPTSFENEEYIVAIGDVFFRIRPHTMLINKQGRLILENALSHIQLEQEAA